VRKYPSGLQFGPALAIVGPLPLQVLHRVADHHSRPRVSRATFACASASSRRACSSDACRFSAAIALPASVLGPVDRVQGRQDRISSA